MDIDPASLRSRIEALTLEMTGAAGDQDWARASDLGEERRQLLDAFFASTDESAAKKTLIENILRSDRAVARQARSARSEVSDELAEHRHSRRALGAYREAASTVS